MKVSKEKFLPYFFDIMTFKVMKSRGEITQEVYMAKCNAALEEFSKSWILKDMKEIRKIGLEAAQDDREYEIAFKKIYKKRMLELNRKK